MPKSSLRRQSTCRAPFLFAFRKNQIRTTHEWLVCAIMQLLHLQFATRARSKANIIVYIYIWNERATWCKYKRNPYTCHGTQELNNLHQNKPFHGICQSLCVVRRFFGILQSVYEPLLGIFCYFPNDMGEAPPLPHSNLVYDLKIIFSLWIA